MKFKALFISACLLPALAVADISPNKRHEVNYLLNFVQQSRCMVERNGKTYNGVEARDHMQNKYDYYRNDIQSTEDFIKYSATKSMISGKYYMVSCPGKGPMKVSSWLQQALELYRMQRRF